MWTHPKRLSPHYIDLHFTWKPFQVRRTTLSIPKPGVNKQVILLISSSCRARGTLCVEKHLVKINFDYNSNEGIEINPTMQISPSDLGIFGL